MLAVQSAVLGALLRAQPFLTDNADALTSVDLTTVRKRLDDIVTSFTTHAVDQDSNDRDAKGETAKQQQLRITLSTDFMRPIAEIARRNLQTVPEFKALRMPPRVTGPAFLANAQGMAQAAAIHKETLTERGLPADFLDHFQGELTTLESSMTEQEQSRGRRIGATQGLRFQEQEGRSVLKVLDALVHRALRGNEALLATWQGVRAIRRRPGRPTTPSTTQITPTETPATTPVATAA